MKKIKQQKKLQIKIQSNKKIRFKMIFCLYSFSWNFFLYQTCFEKKKALIHFKH
jgi:hypothetical protein